jgi:hypothetical protein
VILRDSNRNSISDPKGRNSGLQRGIRVLSSSRIRPAAQSKSKEWISLNQ